MEDLARSLMVKVPALAGVPLWAMTLLVVLLVAAVLLVFALTFGGLGSYVLRKVAGDIQVRVINTPTAHICDAHGHVPHATIMAVNDELARIVERHKGRILALATVDGYDGEASARELERALEPEG